MRQALNFFNMQSENHLENTPPPPKNERSKSKRIQNTGSKHKLQISIQKGKEKFTNRKSIKRRIAEIKFKWSPRKKEKWQLIVKKYEIDNQVAQELNAIHSKINPNYDFIDAICEKIVKTVQVVDEMKAQNNQVRKRFSETKNAIMQAQVYSSDLREEVCNIKKLTNEIHFSSKKCYFEFAIQQTQMNRTHDQNEKLLEEKNKKIEQHLAHFQFATEKLTEQERKSEDLKYGYAKVQNQYKEKLSNYNMELSQLFVLKFQLNNNFYCGFMVSAEGCEKKMALEKESCIWEKTKQIKMDYEDLKRFIVIQLYRGWKNLIRKLSYQSSQYQVLFGEAQNQIVLQDLKRLLGEQKPRASNRRFQKAISFYSEARNKKNHREKIKSMLQNFDNGLIHIKSVEFSEFQGKTELQIHYTYVNEDQLTQKFIYEDYGVINKDKIIKDIKMADRRMFTYIEIPLVSRHEDFNRYQEVYEVVRKKKLNANLGYKSMPKLI